MGRTVPCDGVELAVVGRLPVMSILFGPKMHRHLRISYLRSDKDDACGPE